MVPDPEIALENLVETKHHKLARSLRSGPTDRDMKPDAKTRDHLNVRFIHIAQFNALSNLKILDSSKLEAFAD